MEKMYLIFFYDKMGLGFCQGIFKKEAFGDNGSG